HDAAHDHVLDECGIEVVALNQRLERVGGEVDGVNVFELAVAASEWCADSVDDDGVGHCGLHNEEKLDLTEQSSLAKQSREVKPQLLHCHSDGGPMQQVLILRHGESEWNVERRWQGWIDIGLTTAGEEQAARRARQLARDSFRPRALYASDLKR